MAHMLQWNVNYSRKIQELWNWHQTVFLLQDPPGGTVDESLCQPMQRTWVWSLVQEDSTCLGAAKPMGHIYWSPPALHKGRRHCNEKLGRCREPQAPLTTKQWRPSAGKNKNKLFTVNITPALWQGLYQILKKICSSAQNRTGHSFGNNKFWLGQTETGQASTHSQSQWFRGFTGSREYSVFFF